MILEKEIFQDNFKSNKHKAILNIFYTYNWLYEKHVRELKPYDLTVQQFNILRILRGQYPKPASIKLLKQRMLDKMSDVSRLVEKLRIKGLVERTTCSNDRRNVDVKITEKGLELLSKFDLIDDALQNS
ncbi:MAG TPA: MarR family transcriptional regulator, partial [Bacteroidia bacterium]|nr:MarR family transcriptional regulator [Bacteroidia bacterium]